MLTGARVQPPQALGQATPMARRRRLSPGWRLAFAAAAWLAGVGWQLQQPALWPTAVHQALVAAGV